MEPLLARLARDFSDANDLSERLHELYRVCARGKDGREGGGREWEWERESE